MEIKIYTSETCPWCKKLRDWLKKKKVPFQELNLTESDHARDELIQKSGQLSVPIIDIDGEIIVGFQEERLEKLIKKKP